MPYPLGHEASCNIRPKRDTVFVAYMKLLELTSPTGVTTLSDATESEHAVRMVAVKTVLWCHFDND